MSKLISQNYISLHVYGAIPCIKQNKTRPRALSTYWQGGSCLSQVSQACTALSESSLNPS